MSTLTKVGFFFLILFVLKDFYRLEKVKVYKIKKKNQLRNILENKYKFV